MVGFSSAEGQALGDPSFSKEERSYLMDHGRPKKRTSTSNGKVCEPERHDGFAGFK
jgi:hypothetical protein